MSKEDLEKEIAKGNVSPIAFYNPDGSNMLYTQKYVEEKDKEIERLNNIILNQQKRIDKIIQAIDEILIYNDLSDTTSAFGNAPRELKFYLSECDTLEEFDKLKELKKEGK